MSEQATEPDLLETVDLFLNGDGSGIGGRNLIRKLAAEIASLRSSQEAGSEWRTIETAPKDGTSFIGAFWSIRWADSHRKGQVVACWWQPEFKAFISSCREMTLAAGYTFADGSARELHSPVIEPVTHWMPMPKPPAE